MAFSPYIQMLVNDGAQEIWVLSGDYVSGNSHILSATLTATNSGTIRTDYPLSAPPWTLDESLNACGSVYLGANFGVGLTASVPKVISMSSTLDWTIEWWMTGPMSPSPNLSLFPLVIPFSTVDNIVNSYGRLLQHIQSGPDYYAFVLKNSGTTGNEELLQAQWPFPLNISTRWIHYAIVYTGNATINNADVVLYREGVELSRSFKTGSGAPGVSRDYGSRFTFGSYATRTALSATQYFMFSVYQQALSASVVLSHSRIERWYSSGSINYDVPESYTPSDVFMITSERSPENTGPQTSDTTLLLSENRVGGNSRQMTHTNSRVN